MADLLLAIGHIHPSHSQALAYYLLVPKVELGYILVPRVEIGYILVPRVSLDVPRVEIGVPGLPAFM